MPGARNALLTESGRLSAHATFLAGTFGAPPSTIPSPATETGSEPAARREVQLGEGFGSSIKMANWRAAEDALRRFFLSSRRDPWRYSEADATPLRSGLPSDTWTGSKQWSGWSDLLDHEGQLSFSARLRLVLFAKAICVNHQRSYRVKAKARRLTEALQKALTTSHEETILQLGKMRHQNDAVLSDFRL